MAGVDWFQSLSKTIDNWALTNNLEKAVTEGVKKIYEAERAKYVAEKKKELEENSLKVLFKDSEVRQILASGKLDSASSQKLQAYSINKRKEESLEASKVETEIKDLIKDSKTTPVAETVQRAKSFVDKQEVLISSLKERLHSLQSQKNKIPEDLYYAELDHLAHRAANQIMDASRMDDFIKPLSPDMHSENDKQRIELAKIYQEASKEGFNKVNQVNKYLYADLNLPEIPEGMTYFGNMLSPSPSDKWVRSPYQVDPPRLHPTKHTVKSHTGMDFSSPLDTPIKSTVNGAVSIGNNPGGYGLYVDVKDNRTGLVARVAHIDNMKDIKVEEGQVVEIGTLLGFSGQNGPQGIGPHVHYEVLKVDEKGTLKQMDPRPGQLKGDRK